MRQATTVLILVFTLLLSMAGSSLARAVLDAENRVGVSEPNTNIDALSFGAQSLEPHRENTIAFYDPMSGVLFYVMLPNPCPPPTRCHTSGGINMTQRR